MVGIFISIYVIILCVCHSYMCIHIRLVCNSIIVLFMRVDNVVYVDVNEAFKEMSHFFTQHYKMAWFLLLSSRRVFNDVKSHKNTSTCKSDKATCCLLLFLHQIAFRINVLRFYYDDKSKSLEKFFIINFFQELSSLISKCHKFYCSFAWNRFNTL